MKKKLILVMFLISYIFSYSDNNNYKLGDEITVKINNTDISEIKNSLEEFKIESIESSEQELKNSFIVKFRSFNLGENRIKVGDQEIVLNIGSNIKNDEKKIYLNYDDENNNKLWLSKFPYMFFLGVVGVIFSCYKFWLRYKKTKQLLPHEKYLKGMSELDDIEYAFKISYILREYIDSQFSVNFLSGEYEENIVLVEKDIKFIEDLDYEKFSGRSKMTKSEAMSKADIIYKKIQEYKKEELERIKRGEEHV